MDEKGTTSLSDLAPPSDLESRCAGSALPMYLIVVSGAIPGAMLRLAPEGTRLGRAVDNTYPLSDPTVSRHHAFVAIDAQGVVRLSDLASSNGTFLNGRR